jgi:hypothetical protein
VIRGKAQMITNFIKRLETRYVINILIGTSLLFAAEGLVLTPMAPYVYTVGALCMIAGSWSLMREWFKESDYRFGAAFLITFAWLFITCVCEGLNELIPSEFFWKAAGFFGMLTICGTCVTLIFFASWSTYKTRDGSLVIWSTLCAACGIGSAVLVLPWFFAGLGSIHVFDDLYMFSSDIQWTHVYLLALLVPTVSWLYNMRLRKRKFARRK